jgi:hypothetical protein
MVQDGAQEGKSRQDQILLLAAEGMTDKEIAARLSLSPETVGTYWRRILSKYSAASRTEVVAKVVRLQAEATVSEINEINECLKEVADHLLVVLSGRDGEPNPARAAMTEAALYSLPDIVVVLDFEGFVAYQNRPLSTIAIETGAPFEWSVPPDEREPLREIIAAVVETGETQSFHLSLTDEHGSAQSFPCRIAKTHVNDDAGVVLQITI